MGLEALTPAPVNNLLAWEILLPAAGDGHTLAAIREDVANGEAQLWRVTNQRKPAYVVTRVEQAPHGPELVLVLGAGSGLDTVARWADEVARVNGWTLRTHVSRPGMVRMYQRHGWHVAETVLRKTDHGR